MERAENPEAAGTRAYHHGELRAALIAATDLILRENGIEGFSLRDAARRAGVSPGAPAHHFGNASGLLTEVALLGYEELRACLRKVEAEGSPTRRLRALAAAYVAFALDHPGRFRLMFRKDLINRADPRYKAASAAALMCFSGAAAAHAGITFETMARDRDYGPVLAVWATAHGVAGLALEGKFDALLEGGDPRADFLGRVLPGIVSAQWPEPGSTRERRGGPSSRDAT